MTLRIIDDDPEFQGGPGERESGQGSAPAVGYADLIADIREWRDDPQSSWNKAHTDRWDRVLLALGETVLDTSLTAMTASEAQGYADRGWSRWIGVADALRDLESTGQPEPEVEVEAPNRAPTITGLWSVTIINESGTQGVPLAGALVDPDGDELTVGASSSDESVATVSAVGQLLTVSAKGSGTATITVTAYDGRGGTASGSFIVTVKSAPVVSSTPADVTGLKVGDSQLVSLSGVFSDADGDDLTISADAQDDGIAYPTMSADGASLTLTGVAAGETPIWVVAVDPDGNQAVTSFKVTVAAQPTIILTPPDGQQSDTTQEPDTGSQEPDAGTQEPDAGSQTPDTGSQEPDATAEEPDAGTQEPDATAQEPEVSDIVKSYDADGDGSISRTEMGVAIRDYADGKIAYTQVVEIYMAFRSS